MITFEEGTIDPEELDKLMKKYPGMRKKVHKNGDIIYSFSIITLIKNLFKKIKFKQ